MTVSARRATDPTRKKPETISRTLRAETMKSPTTSKNPKTTTSLNNINDSSIDEILPPKISGKNATKKTA